MKTILRLAIPNSQSTTGYTIAPVEAPNDSTTSVVPEFIRLPKPGSFEPFTGLTRSKLNQLILPSVNNGFPARLDQHRGLSNDPASFLSLLTA